MKKTILTILMIAAAITTAAAQPRAAGIRIGATGLDASYQHTMNSTQFIGADLTSDTMQTDIQELRRQPYITSYGLVRHGQTRDHGESTPVPVSRWVM